MSEHYVVLGVLIGFLGFFYIILNKIGNEIGCECHEEETVKVKVKVKTMTG